MQRAENSSREKKGIIFDIRRFSTHDGTGIRTNIFFKGCPLRCVWCQNPEGLAAGIRPIWFESKCMHCGSCLAMAKHGGVRQDSGRIRLDHNCAEDWDAIADECPTGAIAMDAREYTVEEIVREAKKDMPFFRKEGGVTISGGEPFMQAGFATELLRALKECGIHTAIESSFLAPQDKVAEICRYLDIIYADMKLFLPGEHLCFTGVSNAQIRENLTWLLTSEHRDKVIIRTPLIPGMTATEENLSAIAGFLSGLYPDVKYELLNYNPLAEAKYHLVDREYCFRENPKMYSREQMVHFGEIVKAHGIRNLVLEI